MKRFAFRLLLFLLLGTIINIAAAWGCVLGSRGLPVLGDSDLSARRELELREDLRFGPEYYIGREYSGVGIVHGFYEGRTLSVSRPAGSNGGRGCLAVVNVDHSFSVTRVQGGWPTFAVRGEEQRLDTGNSVFSGAIAAPSWCMTDDAYLPARLLPLRPIWPGFAINTIFYGAVLWVLFAFPFALRRWRRIKRGLCVRCGYSLRGNSGGGTCPECGAAIAMPDSRKPTAESPQ